MLDFDATIGTIPTDTKTPYQWLTYICNACGVTLGMTAADCRLLPNGLRELGYSGVSEDVETYRDLLSYLAAATASVAYVDRTGKLVLSPYGMAIGVTVPAKRRFSSSLSDYRTYYTGLYATYKEGGESEYFSNTDLTGADDGLVYSLGINPFLQITNETNRKAAVQAIIDTLASISYVPFEAEIPANPALEPLDVLFFTGGQASVYDWAAITSITYKLHGNMTVKSVGENPRLVTAKSRYTKNIEGLLSSDSSGVNVGGKAFWLVHDTNTETGNIVIGSTDTLACDVNIATSVDVSKTGVMFTASYILSASALVTATITVDDTTVYSASNLQDAGTHAMTVTTGYDLMNSGEHTFNAYLRAVDQKTGEETSIGTLSTSLSTLTERVAALEAAGGEAG